MTQDRMSHTSKKSYGGQSMHDSVLHSARKRTSGSPDVGIISLNEIREIRNQTMRGGKADAIIIKANDLDDIK